MVRGERVQEYRVPISSLVATAGGIVSHFTTYTINGEIDSVRFEGASYTGTGSLFINVSGTNERILAITSGTATNNVGGTFRSYPRFFTNTNTNASLSGTNAAYSEEICVNSPLHIVGSGLGNATSGLGIIIYY